MSASSLYIVTVIGLVFDLIGAFFVSVEAMKLENFRRLYGILDEIASENVIMELLVETLVGIRHLDANRIRASYARVRRYRSWPLFCVVVPLFLVFGTVMGWYAVHGRTVPSALLFGVISLLMVRVVFLDGAGSELRFVLKALEFIDSRTPSGFVGVIGFLCLVVGFILQAAANLAFSTR